MAEKTRILVTGATGNVGSLLVEKLALIDNVQVRAAVRSLSKAQALQKRGIEVVDMDLANPQSIVAALSDVNKVFLLTPAIPQFTHLTEAFCEAALQSKTLQQIVKLSVMGAKAESPLQLSRQHYQSEQLIEATNIPYTFIRPTAFAQQFTGIFPWVYRQGESAFYLPIGDAKVAWLDIRDIATVTAQILTTSNHLGKTYNLTGPTPVSCPEIAEMITQEIGQSIHYVNMEMTEYQQRMEEAGLDLDRVKQMSIIYGDMKDGWLAYVSEDFTNVMGHEGTKFSSFVRDYIQVWQ